ncbi:histidine kinase [Leptospira ryugenii]|uniref:histidine kinase n=1 Tax=Leptospira ryugenii TaxID=1917863 RepID=A0A2P2E3Y9_9LEPT|nr:sensor histidine kinase [Leptospira ryugenii]GBF51602.1 histidine kinase [Leptospira ryugenii]
MQTFQINEISIIDLIGLVFCTLALIEIVSYIFQKKLQNVDFVILSAYTFSITFVFISNIFEHGFLWNFLDEYEGFFKDLHTLFFLVFLYIQTMNRIQSERIQHEKLIQEGLEIKTKLLMEIHHRVNNNLQMISGLITLQKNSIQDQKIIKAFEFIYNRIFTIASVHRLVYQSKDILRCHLRPIIESILEQLKMTFMFQQNIISLHMDVDADLTIDLDRAIILGLILNELICNSFQHAFAPEQEGIVEVRLQISAEIYELNVYDNGIGWRADSESTSGIGLVLVSNLVSQLNGNLETTFENGTNIKIIFPSRNIVTV